MDERSMKIIASDLVASIKAHVADRVAVFQSRLDALQRKSDVNTMSLEDLRARVDALEAELARLQKPRLVA